MSLRSLSAAIARSLLILTIMTNAATAETIAIIGTGDVGAALGPEFAAQGHTIIYGSRQPNRGKVELLVRKTGEDASAALPGEAASAADIVVLAVPGLLVEEITRGLGNLSGKIIIDPTNPLERTLATFTHAVDT
ncbi:MAG: NAD(P)-binding domain-containing protein, partial [Gammaproteobacteria bacterium]|nr:NAD(P)-binding domain-containing protein [Gammaproteobacteria bacterium]